MLQTSKATLSRCLTVLLSWYIDYFWEGKNIFLFGSFDAGRVFFFVVVVVHRFSFETFESSYPLFSIPVTSPTQPHRFCLDRGENKTLVLDLDGTIGDWCISVHTHTHYTNTHTHTVERARKCRCSKFQWSLWAAPSLGNFKQNLEFFWIVSGIPWMIFSKRLLISMQSKVVWHCLNSSEPHRVASNKPVYTSYICSSFRVVCLHILVYRSCCYQNST